MFHCKNCLKEVCLTHICINDQCTKCVYSCCKVVKFSNKYKNYDNYLDYYVNEFTGEYFCLYKYYNSFVWVSGAKAMIIDKIIKYQQTNKLAELRISMKYNWTKVKSIKIRNYIPGVLYSKMIKVYDNKFNNIKNKLKADIYLTTNEIGMNKDYYDEYNESNGCLLLKKYIKYFEHERELGVSSVTNVLHPSMCGRASEFIDYVFHCIKRDGIKAHSYVVNPAVLYNHENAFEGIYRYNILDDKPHNVRVFNIKNQNDANIYHRHYQVCFFN